MSQVRCAPIDRYGVVLAVCEQKRFLDPESSTDADLSSASQPSPSDSAWQNDSIEAWIAERRVDAVS